MLFRVAILRALKGANLSDADRGLLVHYALLPRVRRVVDGKPCMVDMLEEAEAEMTKAAMAQGLAPVGASIDWSNLLNLLVQNLPAIISLITELVAAFGGKA
jgi:hypothetical protein